MHSFSVGELLIILAIIVILFGGSRLSSLGKSLGEGISNFRKGLGASTVEEKQAPRLNEKDTTKASDAEFRRTDTDPVIRKNVVDVETTSPSERHS